MQYFGFDRPPFAFKTFGFGDKAVTAAEILAMFAGGKQGVFYDPRDKPTLYQDAAGTIPVTTDGDPVGLMLDLSRELKLGSEVISANSNPLAGAGIIMRGTSTALTDGYYKLTSISSLSAIGVAVASEMGFINKKTFYKVVLDVTEYNDITAMVVAPSERPNSGLVSRNIIALSGIGRYSTIVYSGNVTALTFYINGLAGGGITLKMSVKEIEGNHAVQSISASRPTYQKDASGAWLYNDKVDDKMVVNLPAMTATVVTATDDAVTINYPVIIAAGDRDITTNSTLGRDYGRIIIDKELTAAEKANLTAYFNSKRGV